MKIRRAAGLAALFVAAGLFLAGYFVVARGFSAREEPSRVEVFLARNLRRLAIPSEAKAVTNPSPLTAERLPAAQDHWVAHCSGCHALDGGGDTPIGKNLFPKPPDMKAPLTQDLSDGEIYYIISNGIRFTGMPAWGNEDSPEDIWDLVSFIRKLPGMTPEEFKLLEQKAAGGPDAGASPPTQPPGHTHAPGTPPHTH
jgi:mono/diheme cytochrome c family protein